MYWMKMLRELGFRFLVPQIPPEATLYEEVELHCGNEQEEAMSVEIPLRDTDEVCMGLLCVFAQNKKYKQSLHIM